VPRERGLGAIIAEAQRLARELSLPKRGGHPKCLCERQLFRARRIANIGVVFHHDRSRFNHRSNCSRIGSRREGCDGGRADAPCPCFTGELILPCLEACRRVAALCGARFAGYAHERHHCNDGGCLKSLASIHPLLIGAGKSLNTVRSHVPSNSDRRRTNESQPGPLHSDRQMLHSLCCRTSASP
jgi:hypothetical protein